MKIGKVMLPIVLAVVAAFFAFAALAPQPQATVVVATAHSPTDLQTKLQAMQPEALLVDVTLFSSPRELTQQLTPFAGATWAVVPAQATPGTLVEVLNTWGLPPLNTFAKQVDLVAQKGVEGAAQMGRNSQLRRIAQGLARQYRETLQRNAEGLENQLLLPTMLFIFLPFLVAVLATIGLPIMGAF